MKRSPMYRGKSYTPIPRSASQQTRRRDPAARCARSLPVTFAFENQRAQAMPDARCTRGLARNVHNPESLARNRIEESANVGDTRKTSTL